MTMRNLRNQMVHEYIEDPVVLSSALQTGHAFVPTLIAILRTVYAAIVHSYIGLQRLGWILWQ